MYKPTIQFWLKNAALENVRELDEHRLAVHWLGCGICGEMSDTKDGSKSCFFSHLVYVNDWYMILTGRTGTATMLFQWILTSL